MESFRLDLTAQVSSDDQTNVTRLAGKLTLETVHNFISAMRADPTPRLVLDMSGVSFLDSAGVGALVQIFVHRKAQGQTFALVALPRQSDAVMTVAGIKKFMPIYESVEQARAAAA